MDDDKPDHFLIQVERPGELLDLASIERLLEGSGVEVDPGYGPIAVDPGRTRFVVRGWATPQARRRAERIKGIRFFADPQVRPAR